MLTVQKFREIIMHPPPCFWWRAGNTCPMLRKCREECNESVGPGDLLAWLVLLLDNYGEGTLQDRGLRLVNRAPGYEA